MFEINGLLDNATKISVYFYKISIGVTKLLFVLLVMKLYARINISSMLHLNIVLCGSKKAITFDSLFKLPHTIANNVCLTIA